MNSLILRIGAILSFPLAAFAADIPSSLPPLSRMAFLGDSITAGVGVKSPADRYSTVTTRLLQERFPNLTEINLGRSGQALSAQKPDYAEAEVLSKNPDAVLIQWGVNDQYWGYSVSEFVSHYEKLVSALRAAKPEMPIVLTTPIADFRWPENQDVWISQAGVAIQEIAMRYRCHLADTHHALDHQKSFYADSIHPNNAGAQAMAKAIVEALGVPPLSQENARIRFDQGAEIRFRQYVFLPDRQGTEPRWTAISDLSPRGMTLDSQIPITIRTAPIYPKGEYRIEVRGKSGTVLETIQATAAWARMLTFKITPKEGEAPFQIQITASTESGTPPGK
jgi:lysophospholipase L1-like esterase